MVETITPKGHFEINWPLAFPLDGKGQTVKILYRPIPRPVPHFDRLSRSVPWQDFELVLLSRDNEGTSIPLSRKIALSRPVGNPTSELLLPSKKNLSERLNWPGQLGATIKVHIFWEGHKILQNHHLTFDWHYITSASKKRLHICYWIQKQMCNRFFLNRL